MATRQIVPLFNTFVREKYRSDLVLTEVGPGIVAHDDRWEEATLKAIIRRGTTIQGKGRQNILAILQIERLK